MRLENKIILITASTRGIGLACVKACAKEGAIVYMAAAVVYFASDESAFTTGQILAVSGGFGLATPIYGDVTGSNASRT